MRILVNLTAAAVLVVSAGCRNTGRSVDTVVPNELGRTQAAYTGQFGAATSSPVTPDRVVFTAAPGTRLVARFVAGKSVEELWIIDADGAGVPAALAERAQALLASEPAPVRTIVFRAEGRPHAETFEEALGAGLLRVERRNGRLSRIALCADRTACVMLGQMQESELAVDEMMAAGLKAMRAQQQH
ncbi:MAG: hypothetical protein HY699_21870 [Deltaproteobacteria bacterium]|nr:hypothetical protein [Deltaproteobacteria bacterium]